MVEPSLAMQHNKEGFDMFDALVKPQHHICVNHQTCIPSNGPVSDGEEETLA